MKWALPFTTVPGKTKNTKRFNRVKILQGKPGSDRIASIALR